MRAISSSSSSSWARSWASGAELVEYCHGARPTRRGAADLDREAGDGEAIARQRLEIVQLLEVAIADVAAGFVAFPDQAGVAALFIPLGSVHERRVPAPGIGTC